MFELYYKMINEENSVLMKFDNEDELYEFLDDCLNIDYNELSIDLLKKYKNIEVMVLNDDNGNIIVDYMKQYYNVKFGQFIIIFER